MKIAITRIEFTNEEWERLKAYADESEIRAHLRDLGKYALLENLKEWESE